MSEAKEYQDWTRKTAVYLDSIQEFLEEERANWNNKYYPHIPGMDTEAALLDLLYASNGLGSEVGEVQGIAKKILRDHKGTLDAATREMLKKELGDVLWYVARLCAVCRLDMGEVMEYNKEKLEKRLQEGKIKGSGDNR